MTFELCFHYSHNPLHQDQWDLIVEHFAPGKVWLLGEPVEERKLSKPLRLADAQFIQSIDDIGTPNLVLMSPVTARFHPGSVSIDDFTHPDPCVYLFGPDNSHLLLTDVLREPDYNVFIPLADDAEMYSFMAAALTLYDRKLRNGRPDH